MLISPDVNQSNTTRRNLYNAKTWFLPKQDIFTLIHSIEQIIVNRSKNITKYCNWCF